MPTKTLIFLAFSTLSSCLLVDSSSLPIIQERPEKYHPIKSLYHSQDSIGRYVYGYSTPAITRTETKSSDGVTQGGYSYIDANGILQTVQYTADALHGFRVAASNLPQDLPEVALAKAQHLSQFTQIAQQRSVKYSNPVAVPISQVPQLQLLPQPVQDLPEVVKARNAHLAILGAAYAGQILQPVQDLPEVAKARAEHLEILERTRARDLAATNLSPWRASAQGPISAPVQISGSGWNVGAPAVAQQVSSYIPAIPQVAGHSQYHSQDGLGLYSYGYVSPLSSKSETKSADGVTRGGYSYIDANGILQTVNYISDPVNGFRVAATNLPVAPKTTVVAPAEPQIVQKAPPAAPVAANSLLGDGAQYTHEVLY